MHRENFPPGAIRLTLPAPLPTATSHASSLSSSASVGRPQSKHSRALTNGTDAKSVGGAGSSKVLVDRQERLQQRERQREKKKNRMKKAKAKEEKRLKKIKRRERKLKERSGGGGDGSTVEEKDKWREWSAPELLSLSRAVALSLKRRLNLLALQRDMKARRKQMTMEWAKGTTQSEMARDSDDEDDVVNKEGGESGGSSGTVGFSAWTYGNHSVLMEGDEYASSSDDDGDGGDEGRKGEDGEIKTREAGGATGSKKRKKEQSRRVCFGSRNGRSKQTDCDLVYSNQTARTTSRPAIHKNGVGSGVAAAVAGGGGDDESQANRPAAAATAAASDVKVASAATTKLVTELTIRIPCTMAPTTEKDVEKVTKEDGEGVEKEDEGGGAAGQGQNQKKKRCGCRIGRGARAIVRLNANNTGEILEKYCRFVDFDSHPLKYVLFVDYCVFVYKPVEYGQCF